MLWLGDVSTYRLTVGASMLTLMFRVGDHLSDHGLDDAHVAIERTT